MTRLALIVSVAIAFSGFSVSAQTLSDQINSVYRAQQAEQLREQQNQQAWAAQQARIAAQQRAERAAAEQQKAEAIRRDQEYREKLRALDVQQKELQLQKLKAQTARENDFIDRELKRLDAETDEIQSQADANRNLSEGAKAFLNKAGDALNQPKK
jgi:hypothetical protein